MNLNTAAGKLTPYAFSCGYLERREGLTLGRYAGTSVYYVRGFNARGEHVVFGTTRLTEARTALRKLAR